MTVRIIFAAMFLAWGACAGAGADDPSAARVLRTIDFEERRLGNPEELPMHWTRVEGPQLPHYVYGRLTTDRARSGKYSFRFDLNGGSVIYRYEPGRIKVQSQSRYRVEVYVQTTVLAHARARLSAYFADIDRRPIPSSIRRSELYAAREPDEPWKHLWVELSADSSADSLVIELELLQPEMYAASTLGAQTLFAQDIRGSAWFDDVAISQVPRVRMSTDRPGNIFRLGDPVALTAVVSDRRIDDLAAQLLVSDAAGKAVYQRSGAMEASAAEDLGPGVRRLRLLLPPLRPGWYEAELIMTSGGQFVGRHKLHFVQLADKGDLVQPDHRFGVIATDLAPDGWGQLPEILPFLGAARVKLAVWSRFGDVLEMDSAGFDQFLVRCQELGVVPTACLVDVPPSIATKIRGDTWSQLLKARSEDWQPRLAYMISRHANHLDRWQLGADGTEEFVTKPEMRRVYKLIYDEFRRLAQKPDLAMPWPAWYEIDGQLPATVAMSVPPAVLPSQLPLYIQDLRRHEGHNFSLTFQLLDRRKYGRELQIRDLTQRIIYALAADARRIDVPLPFTVVREDEDMIKQPQELFLVLRTLLLTLSNSRFRGKVPIAEGIESFLFERGNEGILVLWDRGNRGGTQSIALALGSNPRAMDLWGNVTPLLRTRQEGAAQQVQIPISSMPLFIIGVDANLARLRASVAFDRPLIESSFQSHTRKISFVNPYPTSISGVLKLKGPAGWSINPPALAFSIDPGEKFERDVSIDFPYNSFAGPKTVEAHFHLQDSQMPTTVVPLTLNLGLSDVGMQTLAVRDGASVVVQQVITNYGNRPIDYTAFAMFPGQARQERMVAGLGPGRSTIKIYRFADPSAAHNRVRTGLKEMAGTRILNDEVEVQ